MYNTIGGVRLGNIQVGVNDSVVEEVYRELDDHLSAINQSQDDIDQNYSYLLELTNKVKLLEQKLERMEKLFSKTEVPVQIQRISLSGREEDIFRIFYRSNRALTVEDIACFIRKSESFVRHYLNEMISKGIPIMKQVINRKAYFVLDSEFKDLQTRHNVLGLDHATTLDAYDQDVL